MPSNKPMRLAALILPLLATACASSSPTLPLQPPVQVVQTCARHPDNLPAALMQPRSPDFAQRVNDSLRTYWESLKTRTP